MRTALIRRQPLRRPTYSREMDHLFDNLFESWREWPSPALAQGAWNPAIDVRENKEGFVVKADLPGVDPKEIKVALEEGVLTIEGERQTEENGAEGEVRWVERHSGSFSRRIQLPARVDAANIQAKYVSGVLEVACPLKPEAKPRKIEIQSN